MTAQSPSASVVALAICSGSDTRTQLWARVSLQRMLDITAAAPDPSPSPSLKAPQRPTGD